MILELEETKLWLRIDHDDEDQVIETLIKAAEEYLINATGKNFTKEDRQAKMFCLILVNDWYENRNLVGQKVGERVRFIIQSMITQLQYSQGGAEDEVQGS